MLICRLFKLPKPFNRHMSSLTEQIVRSSGNTGPVEELIIEKLSEELKPSFLKIANDSHKHSHHKAMQTASNIAESHFRIEIVSEAFRGKNLPMRHRLVYLILLEEFDKKGLHALQMKTKTQEEAARVRPN